MFGTLRSRIFQAITKKEDTKIHLGEKKFITVFVRASEKAESCGSKSHTQVKAHTHTHTHIHTHTHTHTQRHIHNPSTIGIEPKELEIGNFEGSLPFICSFQEITFLHILVIILLTSALFKISKIVLFIV